MGGFWVCVRGGLGRALGRFISSQPCQRNRIQLGLCTVVEEGRTREAGRVSEWPRGLNTPSPTPAPAHSNGIAQYLAVALAEYTLLGTSQSRHAPLSACLPDGESRRGRYGKAHRAPGQRQAASIGLSTALCILRFICRPIAPSVHPSAGPARPLSARSTHVNRRPFNHLDFEPHPIAARVNRPGPAIWGGTCRCCVP